MPLSQHNLFEPRLVMAALAPWPFCAKIGYAARDESTMSAVRGHATITAWPNLAQNGYAAIAAWPILAKNGHVAIRDCFFLILNKLFAMRADGWRIVSRSNDIHFVQFDRMVADKITPKYTFQSKKNIKYLQFQNILVIFAPPKQQDIHIHF